MKSLSLFVGTGKCNANCSHCAGRPLRKYAPKHDGEVNENLILKTAKECYDKGARSLSLSGSGEPMLSPKSITKTLQIVQEAGLIFNPINIYSNGIILGGGDDFSDMYLPLWRSLGLTTVYITVHSVNQLKNAMIYGIEYYPPLGRIIGNIKRHNLQARANMILSKDVVANVEQLKCNALTLFRKGIDKISAWPIRKLDDTLDYDRIPDDIDEMKRWADENGVRLLLEDSKVDYEVGDKLTLFPNGVLSNKWCS
jgi:molybdenum cofactor biosynthesis enzyme MoaA